MGHLTNWVKWNSLHGPTISFQLLLFDLPTTPVTSLTDLLINPSAWFVVFTVDMRICCISHLLVLLSQPEYSSFVLLQSGRWLYSSALNFIEFEVLWCCRSFLCLLTLFLIPHEVTIIGRGASTTENLVYRAVLIFSTHVITFCYAVIPLFSVPQNACYCIHAKLGVTVVEVFICFI